MATELTLKEQAVLFALLVVARPATNRELRDVAGVEVTAAIRSNANQGVVRVQTRKRGAVNTHALTPAGLQWCETALIAGRPDNARFPAGVLFAVLGGIGQHLERTGTKLGDFFEPDIESWVRAVYVELTVRRGSGSWIKLSALRPWLDGVPQHTVDGALDRMIEDSDVRLMAELNQRSLTEADIEAAVQIGGEPRHLLRIGTA